MTNAIILDGHLKSALAAARALARAGVPVRCGAVRASAPTLHSHACSVRFVYPDPLQDLDGFIAVLCREAGEDSVIYTFSDRTTLAVSRHRARLPSGTRLLMPAAPIVESVFDKSEFSCIAGALNVPVPEVISMPDDFPLVIKPRFNCFWHGNSGVAVGTMIAADQQHARRAIDELRSSTGDMPLLQRWVAGEEYGVTVMCNGGDIYAMSAHHRLRSLSPSGGASTAKETIEIPEAFEDAVGNIVRRVSWTGPAMFEFRGDPNGRFVLLEMNGRFWGSLPLAMIAGVDFPVLAFQTVTGRELTGKRTGRIRVFSRHMMGDAARIMRMNGTARFSAIAAFFRGFLPPFHDDLWDFRDPLPWFWDIWDSIIR